MSPDSDDQLGQDTVDFRNEERLAAAAGEAPGSRPPVEHALLRERQWNGRPRLLCTGEVEHVADLPGISGTAGVTGPLLCAECGAPMALVEYLVVDAHPTLDSLDLYRGPGLWTTAKLSPLALIAQMRQARTRREREEDQP